MRERVILEENKELLEFKELYKNMAPNLIFYAGKFVDKATAEDLVQDVFLRLWQKRTPLFLKEGLKTYLYRSIQHACLDYLKHQEVEDAYCQAIINRIKMEELDYYSHDIPSVFEEDERLIRIYEELEKLPQTCRTIFVMSYLEERKAADIAHLMNISKRTVEAQLYKALKILKRNLLPLHILLFTCYL
ncbi:MAG: RNA polymerase sigma-70 factor [Tannerella sp.]|jgi:RNA polymerase sigma-70 factor (ECF subfamily)|nr:RNA polymerase sigma-70 factor [Tannerella sp.]